MEGRTEAVMFNPFEPGYFEDPYAQYGRLRTHDPVHRTAVGIWALFRYDDVVAVLHDSRQSVEQDNVDLTRLVIPPDADERLDRRQRSMLSSDPPDHTRLRKLVQKAFTPRAIRELAPRIRELVDEALDAAEARGDMDVIGDLAFPLPFAVISEMLGMPEADRDKLRGWSHTLVKTLEPLTTEADVPDLMAASDAMIEHVTAAIEWKRRTPADDLLSAMIAAEEEGDRLSTEELLAQVILLFIAGHETTVNLIGNGTLSLLRTPDQLALVRTRPEVMGNGIEELLRYDSPVQFTRRIALEPIDIDGHTVEPGSFIFTVLGAANHDPEHFGPTADELDLTRREAPHHISFGGGIHHCLGAVLARAEARVAITTLVTRYPALALATDTLAWNGRLVLRGLDELPVTL
jgi:cytochrome P450